VYDHYMTSFLSCFPSFCFIKARVVVSVFSFGGESQVSRNTANTCRCILVWSSWGRKTRYKGDAFSLRIQAHDRRPLVVIRLSVLTFLDRNLFVLLVICVFCMLVVCCFVLFVYYMFRASLVRACCLLYGNTPKSWLGDCSQAPTGGCVLTTTRDTGESPTRG
jgi:hypothetical protein